MDTELAYLAGFVDGEGCISIGKTNGNYHLMFYVAQLNPEPLALLHRRFGGSVHRTKQRDGYRVRVLWTTSANMATAAIKQLRPYLVVKAEEADIAIEFQQRVNTRVEKSPEARSRELAAREDLYVRCRDIKRRSYDEVVLPPSEPVGPRRGAMKARLTAGLGSEPNKYPARQGIRDPDRLAKMREMREQGLTFESIAREFGVTRALVWQLLNNYRRKGAPPVTTNG